MKNFKQQYILERQAGHLLRRARQRHSTIFQENIGDPQLTPLQFAALVKLRDLDEVSQNHLGRLTAMDAATMQGVIKRLGLRGLIVRRPDPKDGRRLIISLSNEGKKTISKLVEFAKNVTNETLAPLSFSERNTFLFLLSKVAELDTSED
ncbi:MAG: MarR family winged helix-turn-helix transcriptional regulator [Pseudomonadota bacterium]|nr:MarR family winged helix-turn-helix transcriptional regulator [Pseudomonadota bacterium]